MNISLTQPDPGVQTYKNISMALFPKSNMNSKKRKHAIGKTVPLQHIPNKYVPRPLFNMSPSNKGRLKSHLENRYTPTCT